MAWAISLTTAGRGLSTRPDGGSASCVCGYRGVRTLGNRWPTCIGGHRRPLHASKHRFQFDRHGVPRISRLAHSVGISWSPTSRSADDQSEVVAGVVEIEVAAPPDHLHVAALREALDEHGAGETVGEVRHDGDVIAT